MNHSLITSCDLLIYQEIDPLIGEELIKLFPIDDEINLIPLLKRMKKQTSHRPKKERKSGLGHRRHSSDHSMASGDHGHRRLSVFDRLSLPDDVKKMKVVIHSNSNK